MVNESITAIFLNFAFLLELKGENPFKIRAFQNTARVLEEQTAPVEELVTSGAIRSIPGIGKGSQGIIEEFVKTGAVKEFDVLVAEFPEGMLDLQKVRGLGPKKIKALYEALSIGSLAELEYACGENRLLDLKGFGKKTQDNILKSISELKLNRGKLLLPQAVYEASVITDKLSKLPGVRGVYVVGELRRSCELIASLDFLLDMESEKNPPLPHFAEYTELPVQVTFSHEAECLGDEIVRLTGTDAFVAALPEAKKSANEKDFFEARKLPFVFPEFREAALPAKIPELVEEKDIRGVFHFHTTASDGANSLEEMLRAAKRLGFEYVGVSDHSQTAIYANGLKDANLRVQRAEIRTLQEKFPEIKIFHGIESDILADGSLDYPEEILAKFDFVIASVHSQFKMPREQMTARICRALENPHTTWLGHATGRLLLGRSGYELDMEQVLKTAEKCGKAIELNANPHRLDLDWRWLPDAKRRGISIGIFPDAHSARGMEDFRYGVKMAQKGGLTKQDVSNTKSLKEMSDWLQRSKSV